MKIRSPSCCSRRTKIDANWIPEKRRKKYRRCFREKWPGKRSSWRREFFFSQGRAKRSVDWQIAATRTCRDTICKLRNTEATEEGNCSNRKTAGLGHAHTKRTMERPRRPENPKDSLGIGWRPIAEIQRHPLDCPLARPVGRRNECQVRKRRP